MNALSAKATATREKILRTADELFYLHGYNATGLDAIIGAAGVTKGNFYYYFKSKELLAVEVIEWHFEKVQAEARVALAGKPIGPLERLFTVLGVILKRHKAQYEQGNICGCFFGNFTLELSTDSHLVRNKLDTVFSRYRELFSGLLEEAMRQGEVDERLDPDSEAEILLSLIEGALLLDKARQEPKALEQAIQFSRTHLMKA